MTMSGGGQELKDHGIIFRRKAKYGTTVSCQCRAHHFKHSRQKGGGEVYVPMDILPGETVWQTYNRPENHWIEFTNSDRIRT